jgi:hypothetical protein
MGERCVRNAQAEGSNPFISTSPCLSAYPLSPLPFPCSFLMRSRVTLSFFGFVIY